MITSNDKLGCENQDVLPGKLGGGVRPASQNPFVFFFFNLFSQNPYPSMTKICDIPYPILSF